MHPDGRILQQRGPPTSATRIAAKHCYLVLLGLLGVVLGLLGLVVLLSEPLLGAVAPLEPMPLELGVLVLPLAPPVLLLPLVEESVLKCASHSAREI
jgi:hypothetical protein